MARVRIESEGKPGTKSFRLVPHVELGEGTWAMIPDVVELTLRWEVGRGVAVLTLGVEADTLEIDSEAYAALEAFVMSGAPGTAAEHGVKPGSVPQSSTVPTKQNPGGE